MTHRLGLDGDETRMENVDHWDVKTSCNCEDITLNEAAGLGKDENYDSTKRKSLKQSDSQRQEIEIVVAGARRREWGWAKVLVVQEDGKF